MSGNSLMQRVIDGGPKSGQSDAIENRKLEIYNRLTKTHGMDRPTAIAILANIDVETGGTFDPTTIQKVGKKQTPTGPGFGLVQWEGVRRKALHDWAAENSKSPTDLATQVDFIIHELNTTETVAKKELDKAESLEDKIHTFLNKYERAGKPHTERRIKSGQDLNKSLLDQISEVPSPAPEPEAPSFNTPEKNYGKGKFKLREEL